MDSPAPSDRPPSRRTSRSAAVTVLLAFALLFVGLPAPLAAPLVATPPRPAGLNFEPCSPVADAADAADAATHDLECGTLEVPLSRTDPDAGTVHLAVSRLRATDPTAKRGVLLVNPGGPGGAGLEYAATKGAKMPERVRAAYDIIGFDPRGVGRSVVSRPDAGESASPLDCGPMGGLFDRPVTQGEGPAAIPGLIAAADDCAAAVGPHAAEFATHRVADDIDAIRRALGQERISMLGVSYGTLIADRYARLFGDHVDKFVLDSVVGPGPDGADDWHAFDMRQAEALLSQRDTMIRWWAEHADRFDLGTDPTTVRRNYETVRNLAPSGQIGADEFDRAVYRALGRTERWQPLGLAVASALRTGDLGHLEPVVPGIDAERRNSEAVNRTVVCADTEKPLSPATILAGRTRLRALDPQPIVTGLEAEMCAFWPMARQSEPLPGPQPDVGAHLLFVAGTNDPVTPVGDAERRHEQWPGSGLITSADTWSHGVFASQRVPCVDDAVADFLLGAPAPIRTCTGPGLPR